MSSSDRSGRSSGESCHMEPVSLRHKARVSPRACKTPLDLHPFSVLSPFWGGEGVSSWFQAAAQFPGSSLLAFSLWEALSPCPPASSQPPHCSHVTSDSRLSPGHSPPLPSSSLPLLFFLFPWHLTPSKVLEKLTWILSAAYFPH